MRACAVLCTRSAAPRARARPALAPAASRACQSVPFVPAYGKKLSAKLWAKLEQQYARHEQLGALLGGEGVTVHMMKELGSEKSALSALVELIDEYRAHDRAFTESEAMLTADGVEKELRELAMEEQLHARREMERLEDELVELLIPQDATDDASAIVELRPAAGGLESALFAAELVDYYLAYADVRGWDADTLSYSATDGGGLREAVLSLQGAGVFAYMKFESGVHRVQRVPTTEASGRMHTSTVTVAVLPEAETLPGIELVEADLKVDTFRCGGAGGQHVNKTESGVRITHLPTGITAIGQQERSQHQNRTIARKILVAKLYEYYASRLNVDRDKLRKRQIGTGDRSERIRTYNFLQDRVTDHRLQANFHGIERLRTGELIQDIHDALAREDIADALRSLESGEFKLGVEM